MSARHEANRAPSGTDPRIDLVRSIFAGVLGVPTVGPDDSFFDLGGESLQASRLLTQLQAVFGTQLTPRQFFTAPTPSGVASRLDVHRTSRPPIGRRERHERVPLSFAQQRQWLLNQVAGGGSGYNTPLALWLSGELDVDALRHAVRDVIARHEPLRTVFPAQAGTPWQQVLDVPDVATALTVIPVEPDEARQTVRRYAAEGFDLTEDAPLRAYLFVLGPREHVLLLALHHIAVDGWSFGPLRRDLSAAYRARLTGGAPQWPQLPVQYADYSQWQRDLDDHEDSLLAQQLDYWRSALEGAPERLTLPTDRPRPAVAGYDGGRVRLHLGTELHQRLTQLAKDHQATLFMVIQAGLTALLTRLGAGTDVPVGAPVAGRTEAVLDDLVGFFVNTLVLRTDTGGDPSFHELIERVRTTDLAAFDAADVPFEDVVEAVNPVRSLGVHPLFQVLFLMDTNVEPALDAPGITSRFEMVDIGTSRFELTFAFREERAADGEPCGVDGLVEYSCDVYDHPTVEAIAEQLRLLLEQAAGAPDRPMSRHALLSEAGRHRVLTEWNDSARPLPVADLAALLEQQAERTPSALAAVTDTAAVTYAELHAGANRTARELIRRGAGPERVVAVLLDRSVELLTTLLATVKAGAAYLPVDPEFPDDRVAFMLRDAGPAVVVTSSAHAHRVPGALVLDDPEDQAQIGRQPSTTLTEDERRTGGPAAAAYVIYTSGSTGVPKGVVMPAAGLLNMVSWQADGGSGYPGGVTAHLSSVGFDMSLQETLATLACGGTVAIPEPDLRTDPARLVHWIDRHRVSMIMAPTLMIDGICAAAVAEGTDLPTLTDLVQAGSPLTLSDDLRSVWSGRGRTDRRLINQYGPTETHCAASFPVPDEVLDSRRTTVVPIGRPVWNHRVYVLDETLRPLPPGVLGEVYIAGAGVARGYLARAALTSTRFLPDPFAAPGERMYRTGDLARWNSDGTLTFAGRADHQVKIRGYRVEPGEVEAVVLRHADVTQAVVTAVEAAPGDLRLVAYVAGAGIVRPDTAELRRHVAETLPSFMVPASFVVLDRLPENANGKVDLAALPAPRWTATGRAPRTPQEELLCRLFAEVLGLAEVGVDDGFFDLGGHSLLASRLAGRVRSVLGVDLPVRVVFDRQTVAGIAEAIDGLAAGRPPVRPMRRPDRVPLSFAQQRLWFVEQLATGAGTGSAYHLPLVFELTGELDEAALQSAMGDVIARHEILRTVIRTFGDEPYQHVLAPEPFRLQVVECAEPDVPDTVVAEIDRPFDLASRPPVRARLLRLASDRHVLVICLHHMAADGWSMRPLLRDLSTAYTARTAGHVPHWTPLPVQYADYTLWQREILDADAAASAEQVRYWTQQLARLPEQLTLPADRPRPDVLSQRGRTLSFALDADLHEGLTRLSGTEGVSLFMTLQAALAGLLTRLGAGTDIPIGAPIAGRTDDALSDLIGIFVNTLVLRGDTGGNPTFAELLARTRETDLAAYAHQDVPFERLVEVLNPTRSLSHNPLFQVALVLQNAGQPTLELPAVTVTERQVGLRSAKFDLLFAFTERRDTGGRPQGMDALVEYPTDIFDEETVTALTQRLIQLLRAVADDPGARLDSIDVMLPGEREQLLAMWSG
ncbi:amino acid adenylation domain-containing protein [Streptomyces sp. NPDC127066]|uniref:amino acid adenylation domain-containing protein n=1 Tax=Streptomyces sp. NPDC127066 TaxID=3347125 RepID=UPI00366299BA